MFAELTLTQSRVDANLDYFVCASSPWPMLSRRVAFKASCFGKDSSKFRGSQVIRLCDLPCLISWLMGGGTKSVGGKCHLFRLKLGFSFRTGR